MFDIILTNVEKFYKNKQILKDFSLTIPAGSFFVLLGPSGSGKTTILRLIGGFEYPDSGEIYFGEQDVTDIPAYLRKVNTVFQNYSLFPHLNVYDNIAYGLRIKEFPPFEIRKKIEKIADTFGISKHLYKNIADLSGGEQQRVAIARAIANEPSVLLLDEPISALDFKLRERMLHELADLQTHLKVTFVYVTHDQFEALAVADYIAILNEGGIIEQIGTPKEIYEQPQSRFVAEFIGKTNLINCLIHGAILTIDDVGSFSLNKNIQDKIIMHNKDDENEYILSIRPERMSITPENTNHANKDILIKGIIKNIVYYGYAIEYTVAVPIGIIKILDQEIHHAMSYDNLVTIGWNLEDTVFLKR